MEQNIIVTETAAGDIANLFIEAHTGRVGTPGVGLVTWTILASTGVLTAK